VREHLLEFLRPIVAATGCDLEDVTVTDAGRRSLIRVDVDADGGIDLDTVAEVSRVVSDALDDSSAQPLVSGPYVLEVSSPGVDRPLSEPRHWRRAVGRLVEVSVGAGPATVAPARATLTGRVVDTSTAGVIMEVDGSRHAFEWAELGRGRVQVEFSRQDRPGQGDRAEEG
jgi:ribosome maturation factor RimP